MRLTLSQASGVPFYRQVEDQIADQIRAGRLAPGSALPSVRQLAADLLVSVITVKKAYEDLEAAGLVVSQQGRGTFVADGAGPAARAQLTEQIVGELRALARRARALGIDDATLRRALEDE
ncbi:MAG: GntR family transcriptional regulator [Myxococcota bacterium]